MTAHLSQKAQYTCTEVVDHTQTFTMQDWSGTATNFEEIREDFIEHGEAIRDRYPGHDFVANDYPTNLTNITQDVLHAIWKATRSTSDSATVLNWSCNSTSLLASESDKLAWLLPDAGWAGLYEHVVTPTWADIACKLSAKFADRPVTWVCYDREVASSDPEIVFDEYKDRWRVEPNRSTYAFAYKKIIEIKRESCGNLCGDAQDTILCSVVRMANLIYRSGYIAVEGEKDIHMVCNLVTAAQYFAPVFATVLSRYAEEDGDKEQKSYETNVGTVTVGEMVAYEGDDDILTAVSKMANVHLSGAIPRLFTQEYEDREHALTWMMMEIDFEGRTAYHNRLFLVGAKDAATTRNTQSLFEEFGSEILLNDDRLTREKKELFSGGDRGDAKYIGPVGNHYGTGDHLASWEVNIPLGDRGIDVSLSAPRLPSRKGHIALKVGRGWNLGDSNTPKTRIITGGNVGFLAVENGVTKLVWKSGVGSVMRTVRRVKEIAALSFKVTLEEREHTLEGTEEKVANLVLGGCYGKGPALWLIQQIATGRLSVAESSTACVAALAPQLSKDMSSSEHIDSFLPPEVTSELSVISDGRRVYTLIREDGRALKLEPGCLKTLHASKTRLDMGTLASFKRYKLARPRMIG